MSAEDTLAISLLVILAFAGGSLMTILVSMVRNAGKTDELEDLLSEDEEELEPDPKAGESAQVNKAQDPEDEREAWEQDSDWWKES